MIAGALAGAFVFSAAAASDAITTKTFTVIDGNRIAVDGRELRLDGIVRAGNSAGNACSAARPGTAA